MAAIPDTVTLMTSDGQTVTATGCIYKYSALVKSTLRDSEAADEEIVPLPDVAKAELIKIIEYCTHYAETEPTEIERGIATQNLAEHTGMNTWDVEFINLPNEQLFKLFMASNFMDIKPLTKLCAAKCATLLYGRHPDQLREEHGFVNDLDAEDQEAYETENAWAFRGLKK